MVKAVPASMRMGRTNVMGWIVESWGLVRKVTESLAMVKARSAYCGTVVVQRPTMPSGISMVRGQKNQTTGAARRASTTATANATPFRDSLVRRRLTPEP